MFQSGILKCKVHNMKMKEGNDADYAIRVPWFFITRPKGHIVIDGGSAVEWASDAVGWWDEGITQLCWPVMERRRLRGQARRDGCCRRGCP
jgi:N-acyl homoserine lactone hydrolase